VSAPTKRSARAPLLVFALLLAALAGGYAWWRDGGKRLFQPRNWGVVEEGWLYRSGQIHPRLIEGVLREHGIDLVIDLSRDDPRSDTSRAENEAVSRLGIRKADLWGLNGHGVGRFEAYPEALEEIARAREAGLRVLVHCSAGSERTGGTIALYRMLYQGWSGQDAYAEYLTYRNRPPERDRLVGFLNRNMPDLVARLDASTSLEAPDPLPVFGPPAVSSGP
jgi:hypothetical protein